ncbi:hypothetical protein M5K25_016830 [Dendrobium thyrsiflorum]|uniref:Uncharacterized protein n=1 Tax=Dendrobium thyrsiflorum TaxID=117978 RepID=A0ABD0USK5_DENTH
MEFEEEKQQKMEDLYRLCHPDRKCLRSSVSYPKPKRTNVKTAVYSRKTAQNRGKTHLDAESFRNQHLGYENLLFPFQNQHLDAEFFQIQHLGGRIPPSSRRIQPPVGRIPYSTPPSKLMKRFWGRLVSEVDRVHSRDKILINDNLY